jgi:hypothetical protein
MAILKSKTLRGRARRYEYLYIPLSIVIASWEFLRATGARRHEELCFLAGRVVENGARPSAQVTSCLLPLTASSAGFVTLTSHKQTALLLDTLEQRHEQPLMSLHTHGDGGWGGYGPQHSLIDDHGVALTPEDGLFSGVVPYFAQGSPFHFVGQTSVYERVDGRWVRLSRESKERRIIVHDDTVRIVPVRAAAESA